MSLVAAIARRRWRSLLLGLLGLAATSPAAWAGDRTWDNGTSDFLWNTTSANWSGSTWSNAGDAAIFGGLGQGTITLPSPINVRSFDVTSGTYTLAGVGGLTIVSSGSGTAPPSAILVGTGATLNINTPLTSSIGLFKNGEGTLRLGAPVSFPAPGTTQILGDAVNLQIGFTNSGFSGFPIGGAGTVELTAAGVLPTNASVAIGNGWLNIGAFNTTLGRLVYMNTVASGPYGVNGNNGVYGTGTLKVTGQIVAQYNLGQFGTSNTLAANLDMDGGTQQFMMNTVNTALGYTALHVTGVVSNGSLFKSWTGPQPGGIALYGNNTYTGATTINGGLGGVFTTGAFGNVVAGTNASTELNVVSGFLTLYGASGSFGAAANVNVLAGATLSLDNNSTTNGTNGPAVAAANNNNRLKSDAAVTLSGSTMQLISTSGEASSQTLGSLSTANGFNTVRATATAGGSATWDVTGAWTQGAGATTLFAGTLLGTSSVIKFGTAPTMVGGLIPGAVGNNSSPAETGFVKYDVTNGVLLLAPGDYQSGFGAGGNVSLSLSPSAIATQTINSLRSTATATVSFNPGAVLSVTSGQILATTGTLTIDAATPSGTLAFGSAPATFHAQTGTITVNSPMTGSGGIIKSGTGTLNINSGASLAGMTGTFVHNSGTTTLTTPYTGNIDIISGTFNLRDNLTASGSTMTLGNPLTPANTVGTSANLNLQSTAVTTIAHNLVVTNGTNPNLTAFTASISQQGGTAGIIQEFSGSVTLNSGLNILGGGSTTNVMLFSGQLSGPGPFRVQNGNIRFTNTSTNYGGQFILGNGGNTTVVNFDGTNASTTGTMLIGFGTGLVNSTRVRLNSANAIAGGDITMLGGTLELKNSMNLANNIAIGVGSATTAAIDTPAGVTATLSGVVSSTDSFPTLQKVGAGTLVLGNSGNAYTGSVAVNAGTLLVNGPLGGGASAINVNATGTLGGNGSIFGNLAVAANGTLAPGVSPGTLTIDGNVTFSSGSTFSLELNGTAASTNYDVLNVTGAGRVVTLGDATLLATSTFTGFQPTDRLFILTLDDPTSSLVGTFNGIAQGGTLVINGVGGGADWVAQVSYTGDSASQSLTGGNDVVLFNIAAVPEPGTLALLGGVAAVGGSVQILRRRQRGRQEKGRNR